MFVLLTMASYHVLFLFYIYIIIQKRKTLNTKSRTLVDTIWEPNIYIKYFLFLWKRGPDILVGLQPDLLVQILLRLRPRLQNRILTKTEIQGEGCKQGGWIIYFGELFSVSIVMVNDFWKIVFHFYGLKKLKSLDIIWFSLQFYGEYFCLNKMKCFIS